MGVQRRRKGGRRESRRRHHGDEACLSMKAVSGQDGEE